MSDFYAAYALHEALPAGQKLTHVATVWAHPLILDDPPVVPYVERRVHASLDRAGAPAEPRTEVLRVTEEQARTWHHEHGHWADEAFVWPSPMLLLTAAAYAPVGAPSLVITEESP